MKTKHTQILFYMSVLFLTVVTWVMFASDPRSPTPIRILMAVCQQHQTAEGKGTSLRVDNIMM